MKLIFRLMTVLSFVFILLMSFQIAFVFAQEEINDMVTVDEEFEMFVDLLGSVNWTYYADGSQYEGKSIATPNSISLSAIEVVQGTTQFALSIGAFNVVYYKNADGSTPTTIDELYASDVQAVSLYSAMKGESADGIDFGFGGLGLSQTPDYDGGANNLTVDSLAVDDIDEIYSFSEMIVNNTAAFLDTTIVADSPETTYTKYAADIIDWDKETELIDEFNDNAAPIAETYGTENMTRTVYIWLARLIETKQGYSVNTIDIDDNTEIITSEAITVQYDEDAYNSIRSTIDQSLIDAGVEATDLAGLPSLSGVGRSISKSISKNTGSFSFTGGMSVSTLKQKAAAVKSYAKSVSSTGARVIKPLIKSAIAKTRTAGMAVDKYVQKASAVTTNFLTNAQNKVKNTKFAFLGGIIEKAKKAVSFLLKYWPVWVTLLVLGFILFATPVGPFLMNSTIRKIVK